MLNTTDYTTADMYGTDPVTYVMIDTSADPWTADTLTEAQLLQYWNVRSEWVAMGEEWAAIQHEIEMLRPCADHFNMVERAEELNDGWAWLAARSYIDLRSGAC